MHLGALRVAMTSVRWFLTNLLRLHGGHCCCATAFRKSWSRGRPGLRASETGHAKSVSQASLIGHTLTTSIFRGSRSRSSRSSPGWQTSRSACRPPNICRSRWTSETDTYPRQLTAGHWSGTSSRATTTSLPRQRRAIQDQQIWRSALNPIRSTARAAGGVHRVEAGRPKSGSGKAAFTGGTDWWRRCQGSETAPWAWQTAADGARRLELVALEEGGD